MESRYKDDEARRAVETRAPDVSEDLALRTYTARLLGQDPDLVLHGGGNTSVKSRARTVLGEEVDVLYVKGSGWDLATIEPAGHPAARMEPLLALARLPELSDEAMVNALRLALLDASAPTPSVEALLHAILPFKYVDHTHADAILALADQPDAERVCREAYGPGLVFIPYVMPGFVLARRFAEAWAAFAKTGARAEVMVLEKHGVFTFGDTAKESYERMIEVVTRAERWVADHMRTVSLPSIDKSAAREAELLPILRGALAEAAGEPEERGPVLELRASDTVLGFLARPDAEELVLTGCATPDHVIRTKPTALLVKGAPHADPASLRSVLLARLREYAAGYDAYFARSCEARGVKKAKLDPWPRIVLLPRVGLVSAARTAEAARAAADVYEHTMRVMTDASDVGTYAPVSMLDLFDVEYWSLEQAKIKPVQDAPMSGRVALVTGAASGIGLATARRMLAAGAHVVLADRDAERLDAAMAAIPGKSRPRAVGVTMDATRDADVAHAFDACVRAFGGVDVVVSNAGTAPEGRLETAAGVASLERSLEDNLLSHARVARAGAEILRAQGRGGVLLFNASKAAVAPGPGFGPYAIAKAGVLALMRQHAIDLAKDRVRANAVNADRIRTALFDGGVLESRARARGLEVDAYFRANMLEREVTADDVADAFVHLATARATTGCVVTVDGGNASAFLR